MPNPCEHVIMYYISLFGVVCAISHCRPRFSCTLFTNTVQYISLRYNVRATCGFFNFRPKFLATRAKIIFHQLLVRTKPFPGQFTFRLWIPIPWFGGAATFVPTDSICGKHSRNHFSRWISNFVHKKGKPHQSLHFVGKILRSIFHHVSILTKTGVGPKFSLLDISFS